MFLDHIFYHIRGEKITEKSSFLTKRKGRAKDNDAHSGSYHTFSLKEWRIVSHARAIRARAKVHNE